MNYDDLGLAELDIPEEAFDFKTYKNYFGSLSIYVHKTYGTGTDCFKNLKAACESQGAFARIQMAPFSTTILEEIKKLLFNAWNSEIVLALPSSISPEFVKYANHWSPVQAYYAVYLAIQAFFRSVRLESPPNNHAKSLRTISEYVTRQNLFPPYWNVCCSGAPTLAEVKHVNLPANEKIEMISCLSSPRFEEFWSWYAMLLRTTRERQFKRKLADSGSRFKTKKGTRRKRFTPTQKARVLADLHATTVFDFVYRFRLRSNYEDADAFILGTTSNTDASEFNEALRHFTATTLFIIELQVVSRIGTQTMGEFIMEFRKADRAALLETTVGLREPFLVNKAPAEIPF